MDNKYDIGTKVLLHPNPDRKYCGSIIPIVEEYISKKLVFTVVGIVPSSVFTTPYTHYELKEDRRHILWMEDHLIPFTENKNFIDLSILI